MGSEVAAACCCNAQDFLCEDLCACLPQAINLSVSIDFVRELRLQGSASKVLLRESQSLRWTGVRLLRNDLLGCVMELEAGVGTVSHTLVSHLGQGAPNYEEYVGVTPPNPFCGPTQCYSLCNQVYPCWTETISASGAAQPYHLVLACYDPCRMIGPGVPRDCCEPEGYPYIAYTTSLPSTTTKEYHCPWTLRPGCGSYAPDLCCAPTEVIPPGDPIGPMGGFWGKRGCIQTDSFSAANLFAGPGLSGLPAPGQCPDNGVDPIQPIPWQQAPPNGVYNAYACTVGSCACALPPPPRPTTIPYRPATFTTSTACVVCAHPNTATDMHGCWRWFLQNGNLRHTMLGYCNCTDPPAYDTHGTGTTLRGDQSLVPTWPTAATDPGTPCEPQDCPEQNGCNCVTNWYSQSYSVSIGSIIP